MTVKFIKPDPIKLSDVTAAIDSGLQASGEIVKTEYALFQATWEAKNVAIFNERKPGSSSVTLDFGPVGGGTVKFTDRIWSYITESQPMVWVDDGTPPHDIPKAPMPGGKFLVFQSGFIAKTRPRQISSGPGARFGPTVFAKQVHHPGTEAREISDTIGTNADDHLPRMIDSALDSVESL